MTTEDKVMAQFQSTRAAQNATASFDLDVTKIKNGDTITIDGVTFEFTDSTTPSTKGNIAVNLGAYGISDKAGSIAGYQTANVVNALKSAINNELNYGSASTSPKYTITAEGNKVTLTSNDNAGTTTTKENMVSATITLPEGSLNGKGLVLQIGDTSDDFNQLAVSVGDMHTTALKIDGIDIGNQQGAKDAIQTIKDAINYVSEVRGTLGATQNRLEHTANNLSVMAENIQDAESTIRDTDIAEEMMSYTK
ncbi:MAG: flagellin, partial [Dysosmobacter sp.]|nr:flagellin [Dysosmobacter sp.]